MLQNYHNYSLNLKAAVVEVVVMVEVFVCDVLFKKLKLSDSFTLHLPVSFIVWVAELAI